MKYRDPHSETGETIIFWGDHWPGCEKCREVDIEKSATFANACAQGSPLLMEELARRQAPKVAEKRKQEKEWAEKAGVFVTERSKIVPMKYKET